MPSTLLNCTFLYASLNTKLSKNQSKVIVLYSQNILLQPASVETLILGLTSLVHTNRGTQKKVNT